MTKIEHPIDADPEQFYVLDEKLVQVDPFLQFTLWFKEALDSRVSEPEAMFLATADDSGVPSGRIVLLKGFDSKGFVFFTNYNSRKGSNIKANPFVAIDFHWKEIARQVRITGKAEKISEGESDHYFSSRSLESRISAIISPQSQIIPDRTFLEEKYNEMKNNLNNNDAKRPSHWGGFRIVPDLFEFWQQRQHRLHDRIQYRSVNKKWVIERLAP